MILSFTGRLATLGHRIHVVRKARSFHKFMLCTRLLVLQTEEVTNRVPRGTGLVDMSVSYNLFWAGLTART